MEQFLDKEKLLKNISKASTEEEKAIYRNLLNQVDDINLLLNKLLTSLIDGPFRKDTVGGIVGNLFGPCRSLPGKWFIESGGIICDNENCDWENKNPEINQDTIYLFRNVPCPKCGSNLLTDNDWYTIRILNSVMGSWPIRFFHTIIGIFKKPLKFRVKMNGTGKINLEKVD